MSIQSTSINRMNNLLLWQESHTLMLLVYESVNDFRDDERLPMACRIRRLAKSVPASVGAALGRSYVEERDEAYVYAERNLFELRQYFSELVEKGFLQQDGGSTVIRQIGIADRMLQSMRLQREKTGGSRYE